MSCVRNPPVGRRAAPGRPRGYSSYVRPARASSTSPGQTAAACARHTSGSFHDGMWVSMRRLTPPAATAACGGPRPGEVDVAFGITPVDEGRVGQHQVGAGHERRQSRAAVRVSRQRDDLAVRLDAVAVGLDRVVHPRGCDGERPDEDRLPVGDVLEPGSGTEKTWPKSCHKLGHDVRKCWRPT